MASFWCADGGSSFFREKFEVPTAQDAAVEYASGWGKERGDTVDVCWHPVPNSAHDPELPTDEDNPEFWLAKGPLEFTVVDDDHNVAAGEAAEGSTHAG